MRYSPGVIINIVGPTGCGKSTLITDVFGADWKVFRPSDVLRENAERLGIALTEPGAYPRVHELLAEENPDFMTDAILAHRGKVVIDGLRVYAHAERVQKIVGSENYYTTYTYCEDAERLRRLQARPGRPEGRPVSIADMLQRDKTAIPADYEFDKLLAMANLPHGELDISGTRAENAARYGMLLRTVLKAA